MELLELKDNNNNSNILRGLLKMIIFYSAIDE